MSEFVWAVDPAVHKQAFAFANLDSPDIHVRTLLTRTTETEGARLGLLDRQLRIWARQLAGEFPPACVWVEQASGAFPNLPLTYAIGVIQAALAETLACPVWTISSGKWKKRVLGFGNASKPQIRAHVDRLGLGVESQDEADAICIALAGRDVLRTGRWDVAA